MNAVPAAAIREALVKATPGPWLTRSDDGEYVIGQVDWWVARVVSDRSADAELIVLLRNNAEALLDALDLISDVADEYWLAGSRLPGGLGKQVAADIRATYEGINL